MFDDKEVQRNLENVIANLLPDAITRGLQDAIQSIENDAKANAPVDDGVLKASITNKVEDTSAICGTNVSYAPYVHEGTGIYAKSGNGRKNVPWKYKTSDGKWYSTEGQKPNPFLQDAVDSNMGTILNHFKGVLND